MKKIKYACLFVLTVTFLSGCYSKEDAHRRKAKRIRDRIEEYIQKTDSTDSLDTSGLLERGTGAGSPFTRSLAESNMTTEALRAFNDGCQDYLAGEREDIPSSYRVDFSYGPGGDTGSFKEFLKGGRFTAAQFTGTVNYAFSLDKDGNLNIGVYDTKTEYSFPYHAPGTDRHSRNEGRIMGETTQRYHFAIPLDRVQKRVGQ